jgi:predicted RNase H-like HicB family nuclease
MFRENQILYFIIKICYTYFMSVRKNTYSIKTNYGTFLCVFEPEKDMGGYTAEALEVQGAVTWGKNIIHAKKMIAEAIEGVIETRVLARAETEGTVRIIARPKILA